MKDVVVDSSYSRSLFVDESEKDWEPLETRKGPGKLFTSTSFEEDGGSWREGNGSRGWRRELLAQVMEI